jgi:4-oxalocrotonate tautomerase
MAASTPAVGSFNLNQERVMPYVNIKVTREGTTPDRQSVTAEQKAALIKGVTELLRDVLNKSPNTTVVVIDEVEMDNWGLGGLPVEQWRRQAAK